MTIENVGAYSPDTVYGQLTMPFINKPVTINAHTPFDKEEENIQTSFSQADFQKNIHNAKWNSVEKIRNIEAYEVDENLKIDIGLVEMSEFPPESPVPGFQASTLLEGSGLVYEALRNGYPADKAIVFGKAQQAYAQVANFGKQLVS